MFFFLLNAYFFFLANALVINQSQSSMIIPLVYDTSLGEIYAKISIGTPPQYFDAMIDVQNSHTWIISDKCDPNVYLLCWGIPRFASEKSSTYTTTGEKVEFIGSGSGSGDNKTNEGYISMDVIRIGDIVLDDQIFIEASAVSGGIFTPVMGAASVLSAGEDSMDVTKIGTRIAVNGGIFGLSAVLGLSPGENSSPKIKTLTEAMIDSGIATRFMLSFDAKHGTGQLVFDSPGDSMRNQATPIPLSDPNKWQFNSDLISIGDSTLCETECKVNVDSREFDILFPFNLAEKLTKTVHGHFHPKVRAISFPLKEIPKIPNLDIKANNQTFSLNVKDYSECIMDVCFLQLGTSETEWVMGWPFLEKFDIEFNFRDKTLGFTPNA